MLRINVGDDAAKNALRKREELRNMKMGINGGNMVARMISRSATKRRWGKKSLVNKRNRPIKKLITRQVFFSSRFVNSSES